MVSCRSRDVSAGVSSTKTSSTANGPFSDLSDLSGTASEASDDVTLDEAQLMESVQWHLELMNGASEEVNAIQNALNQHVQQREKLLHQRAVTSARWARAVGVDRLAQAAPVYTQRRRCEDARKNVEVAAAAFIEVVGQQAPDANGSVIAAHAQSLAEYKHAQHELSKVQRKSALSLASLDKLSPYFDAEEKHRINLASVGAKIQQSSLSLGAAKARYHEALRALEGLSEGTHRERGTLAEAARGATTPC